jgi:hypothetical protein
MDLEIFGLFKGSGTLFGAKTMAQSTNAQTQPTTRWVLGQVWVGPPNYHPSPLHLANSNIYSSFFSFFLFPCSSDVSFFFPLLVGFLQQ